MDKEIIERVRRHLLNGNFRCVAGKAEGISNTTFQRWMSLGKARPESLYGEFRSVVLEAEQKAEIDAVAAIYAAGAVDVDHLKWWLERKHAARWARHWKLFEAEIRARLKRIEENGSGPGKTAD